MIAEKCTSVQAGSDTSVALLFFLAEAVVRRRVEEGGRTAEGRDDAGKTGGGRRLYGWSGTPGGRRGLGRRAARCEIPPDGIGPGEKGTFIAAVHEQGRHFRDPQVLERCRVLPDQHVGGGDLQLLELLPDIGTVLAVRTVEENERGVRRKGPAAGRQDQVEERKDRGERPESGQHLAVARQQP